MIELLVLSSLVAVKAQMLNEDAVSGVGLLQCYTPPPPPPLCILQHTSVVVGGTVSIQNLFAVHR